MKTENQKEMTDAVHEYFTTYSIGDVLQVLSNVSFDHLKTMLQVGNIDKETEINKTASTMSMITDLMALSLVEIQVYSFLFSFSFSYSFCFRRVYNRCGNTYPKY